ncbi:type IV secretory system conjugative DNA transfer family protein [Nitrosovibrio sp. Nv6]|uniref:type IV secretory system conjugative DNA transfer family protein n=1 Tax=Nitrosovibrio sp. Nv6 TaxID=1855340 RepID=UPI0008D2C9BC|nr:type IV secretory system conjugative DNA transfer family protein [Nitrosovibrio sp. Nv6]SEP43172.1 type IV secretion system protein VirD4 [Nitrosovibrio sp. Nv6]
MSLAISSLDDQKRALSLIYDTAIMFGTYAVLWGLVVFLGGFDPHPAAPLNAIKAYKASWPDWFLWSIGGSAIAGAVMFGVNPYRRGGNYGGAHFAGEKEIRNDLKLRGDEGLILGTHRSEYLRMDEPLSVLIYAPPGSGKTAGIIIPSLLSCGNSALVHDPKGELHDKTAGFRMRNGHRIIRFEPAAAGSARWNPLGKDELPETWSERISYIDRIANSLVNAGKQGDDYWTREARSLFVFFSLFLTFRDGETSLPGVREFALSQADPQGFVADLLENTPGLPQRVIEEGNGILAKSGNEFSGVFGTFKSFLNSYGDEFIAANTKDSDFQLRNLRESETTIYLVVRNSDQSRLRLFATLFFESAALVLIHDEPTKDERKVTFYLDEFVRLGNMREVLQMPAISRSFKVNVVFVVQSMSQVVDLYGQSGADQLRNTCSYHIVFAQNEQKIAEDISRSIGNRTRKKLTYSSGERNITRNTSEAEEGIPLVLSQEVMSLPAFETLVLMQNHFETPIRARAAAWFKDAVMKKRVEESLKLEKGTR